MRNAVAFLLLMVLAAGQAQPGETRTSVPVANDTPADPKPKVTESWFQVLLEGLRCGYVRRTVTERAERTTYDEKLAMFYMDGSPMIEMLSSVTCNREDPPRPLEATVATKFNNRPQLNGEVTFACERGDDGAQHVAMSIKGTAFTDNMEEPLKKPRQIAATHKLPAGLLLASPAILTVAPKLLPKAGELKDVVVVKIPADKLHPAAAIANMKLTRTEAGADGVSSIALKSADGKNEQAELTLKLDKNGQVTEYSLPVGVPTVIRASTKDEALKPVKITPEELKKAESSKEL